MSRQFPLSLVKRTVYDKSNCQTSTVVATTSAVPAATFPSDPMVPVVSTNNTIPLMAGAPPPFMSTGLPGPMPIFYPQVAAGTWQWMPYIQSKYKIVALSVSVSIIPQVTVTEEVEEVGVEEEDGEVGRGNLYHELAQLLF